MGMGVGVRLGRGQNPETAPTGCVASWPAVPSVMQGGNAAKCPGCKNLFQEKFHLKALFFSPLIWISRALGASSSRKDSHPNDYLCLCKGGCVFSKHL